MPLLTSPIDGSPMKEIERYGIKLDMCPTSGGIWFDKGEVEKLIHFVREEAIKELQNSGQSTGANEGRAHHDRGRHSNNTPHKKRKRENPLAELLDIFEF